MVGQCRSVVVITPGVGDRLVVPLKSGGAESGCGYWSDLTDLGARGGVAPGGGDSGGTDYFAWRCAPGPGSGACLVYLPLSVRGAQSGRPNAGTIVAAPDSTSTSAIVVSFILFRSRVNPLCLV